MNTDPENFEQLRKLLALKKHEQPPPGYFNELPKKIWARIELEEANPSLWQRILNGVALRPAAAYAFGLIVCGTLVFGIGTALKNQPETSPVANSVMQEQQSVALPPPVSGLAESSSASGFDSSTNPVSIPNLPPFQIQVQPAAYNP